MEILLKNRGLLNTKCVFWFSLQLYFKHFSFSELNEIWIIFYKKYQISWKSFQWRPSCCLRPNRKGTGRQADMLNLIAAFRKYANKPKKLYLNKNVWSLRRYSIPLLQLLVGQAVGAKERHLKFKLWRNINRMNFKNISPGLSRKYEYIIPPQFTNHSHSTTG
jgi:hypothetical protein